MNVDAANSTAKSLKNSDKSTPPRALPVLPSKLPADLADCRAFVVWRWWWDEERGAWTKPPYDPRKGNQSNKTAIAVTLAEAARAYQHSTNRNGERYDGIGFYPELVPDCVGVDLDGATTEEGELLPWAAEIVATLNSYTERSPSGAGVRIILYGDIPANGRKVTLPHGGAIEVYKAKRYLTLTGHRLKSTPPTIEARPTQIAEVYASYFGEKPSPTRHKASGARQATTGGERPAQPDGEALRRLQGHDKFERLWRGDDGEYQGDESKADLAFCSMLAVKGASRAEVDRAYRASGRYREKWDSKRGETTYGDMTLDRAFSNVQAPSSTALPALPVLPASVADDDEIDLNALDREAVIVLYQRERDQRRQVEAALQAEHQRRREVEQYQRDFIRGLSNPNWRGEKLTALVMADELVASDARVGERRRLPVAKVAAIAGQSPKSTSEHLNRVAESTGWFERELEVEYTTDEEGRTVARQVSYVTLKVDPREIPLLIAEAAPLVTGKDNTHGGRRVPVSTCPDHPTAKIIREVVSQWTDICGECGETVGKGETKRVTVEAPGHDDGLGVEDGEIEVDALAAEVDPTGQVDWYERPQKGREHPTGQLDGLGTDPATASIPALFDLVAAKGGTPVDRWTN